MKKIVILFLSLVFIVTACSSEEPKKDETKETEETKEEVIDEKPAIEKLYSNIEETTPYRLTLYISENDVTTNLYYLDDNNYHEQRIINGEVVVDFEKVDGAIQYYVMYSDGTPLYCNQELMYLNACNIAVDDYYENIRNLELKDSFKMFIENGISNTTEVTFEDGKFNFESETPCSISEDGSSSKYTSSTLEMFITFNESEMNIFNSDWEKYKKSVAY